MTGPRTHTAILQIIRDIAIQPRWMKLKQAAKYSSLGQKELIQLAKREKVIGFQDKTKGTTPWIFDRNSIDDYRISQIPSSDKDNMDFAIELVNGLDI